MIRLRGGEGGSDRYGNALHQTRRLDLCHTHSSTVDGVDGWMDELRVVRRMEGIEGSGRMKIILGCG